MSDLFKPVPWTVQNLVAGVRSGALRLPDIQRPFVWEKVKVRDLVDSLYRGYPVGELMFWATPGDDDTKTIGTSAKSQTTTHKIVDGQQRLTSLYVVLTGEPVVDDEYRKEQIRIAFNPFTERFEVSGPVLEKNPEWLADISTVFTSPLKARRNFLKRYAASHEIDEEIEEQIEEVFNRLHGLSNFSFQVVELQSHVDRQKVAEIFVRINSEGVNLTQADFILTWLSVFWDEGRDELEDFSRNSRLSPDTVSELTGTKVKWTPKNHYIAADARKMIRVVVGLGQGRGRLRNAYNALRGRDPRTRLIVEAQRDAELALIKEAQAHVLNPTNWDDFMRCLARAGFRSKKMITSENSVLYTYTLWLIGLTRFGVDRSTLRDLMARWFFMAQTTGRYTNSPETAIEEDLKRFDEVESGNSDGFIRIIESVISTVITPDFWSIRLPDDYITSSTAASPAYQAYVAALNILDADLFALSEKVRDWMDPSSETVKGVEGHHLYPRAYLKSLNITSVRQVNQVANFAPTDWSTNNMISDRPPSEYWPELLATRQLTGRALANQQFWHALPDGWHTMTYDEFLAERRMLMAKVVQAGFERLGDPTYVPAITVTEASSDDDIIVDRTTLDLFEAELLKPGDLLTANDPSFDAVAEITEDGLMAIGDHVFDNPRRAARSITDLPVDGWDFWVLTTSEGPVSLRQLLQQNEDRQIDQTT